MTTCVSRHDRRWERPNQCTGICTSRLLKSRAVYPIHLPTLSRLTSKLCGKRRKRWHSSRLISSANNSFSEVFIDERPDRMPSHFQAAVMIPGPSFAQVFSASSSRRSPPVGAIKPKRCVRTCVSILDSSRAYLGFQKAQRTVGRHPRMTAGATNGCPNAAPQGETADASWDQAHMVGYHKSSRFWRTVTLTRCTRAAAGHW
jgi:hypothetical protein